MDVDVEETLERELHAVADGLRIPVLPDLTQEPARTPRRWPSLLAAAAVVLVVLLVAVFADAFHGDSSPQPMPSPVPSTPTGTLPRTAPTAAYVLDQHLYLSGGPVPGSWWSVDAGGESWLGQRTDGSWWWGHGAEIHRVEGQLDVPPALSPGGRYLGVIRTVDGAGVLSAMDTETGEEVGSVPVDRGDPERGTTVFVRAVTDDGRVVAQGMEYGVLWSPLSTGETVDLTTSAPGQQVVKSTSAGLVVGEDAPYLAEISDAGELTRVADLPANDDLVASPGGTWLAMAPAGTIGGEVTAIGTLQAQTVDGSQRVTLSAPDGRGFRTLAWAWEDDEHLISPVVADDADGERMVRCSVVLARCVLIDAG